MQTRIGRSLVATKVVTIALILMGGCTSVLGNDPKPAIEPPIETGGIDWSSLLVQSLGFLAVEHSFRWVTEEGTRHPHRSFFDGYIDSLNSLHGWGDGDPFYVGYVGHPMEGAIAGYLFVQNDRRFRTVEFGKNRQCWK